MASVRQFIELAVNMPEQEPQVGQAFSSISSSSSWETLSSADAIIGLLRSSLLTLVAVPSTTVTLPASMGPPETNTVKTLRSIAASSIPGVILSQLDTHTRASAQWALTMYSKESAMSSRLGSE